MARLDSLSARLRQLEESQGYETLDDGTKFRFQQTGVHIALSVMKHGRDTGREPVLSDFTPEEQRELTAYAKWTPDPALHGQISVITCQMAREIVARSNNGS
jgi:hypothetical protein